MAVVIFVRLDGVKKLIIRREYSFILWFALLGGVSKEFSAIFKKLTEAVSKKMFESSILSDLFFVKRREK